MTYKEFMPGEALMNFVKCYYLYESDTDVIVEDKAFATGCLEIMFNLGTGRWQILEGSDFNTTPFVELWGQIIQPLTFRSLGKNTMLGIRFYPHTASAFLNTEISLFNNQVTDFAGVMGPSSGVLHSRLLDSASMDKRIQLIEEFLLKRLSAFEKRLDQVTLIRHVMNELGREDFFDNIDNVASRYGITSRYLQKLFLRHTGLTPKLYSKINRFQNSLRLVAKRSASLTAVAYECGYFDQSHFIREFKSFTGILPSAYDPANSSASLISPNN